MEYLRKQREGTPEARTVHPQPPAFTEIGNQALLSLLATREGRYPAQSASEGQLLAAAMQAKFQRQFGQPMDGVPVHFDWDEPAEFSPGSHTSGSGVPTPPGHEGRAGQSPNLTGIPTQMKLDFEQRSGLSFDDVRVHYNSDKPAKIDALAYTQGTQVYMGPGQERHLRHELGHVVQQKQGIVRPTTWIRGLPVNDCPALERAADQGPSAPVGPPSLPISQSAAIQRFHVVMPDQLTATNGSPEPIFSTHKVVHDPTGGTETSNPPSIGKTNIHKKLEKKIIGILHQIHQKEADSEQGISPRIRQSSSQTSTHASETDQDTLPSASCFPASSFCFTSSSTSRYHKRSSFDDELSSLYDQYFRLSGRISEPQLQNRSLGAQYFNRDPFMIATDQRTAPQRNRLVIVGPHSKQIQVEQVKSRFYVGEVEADQRHPMLVSEHGQFALTALYPEPKEVYLSDQAFQQVKERLEHRNHGAPTGNGDIERSPFSLEKRGPSIEVTVNDKTYQLHRCIVLKDQQALIALSTTVCNYIRFNVLGDNGTNGLFVSFEEKDQKYVPWGYHHAAILCNDGDDNLTLENGARNAWLFKQLAERLSIDDLVDLKNARKGFSAVKGILEEMNKTWHFRMYGPREYGQDMEHQLISRFKRPGQS